LKNLKKQIKLINLTISLANSMFTHLITCTFAHFRFIITNQVEKMSHGVQWLMNHFPNHRNNYIFNYFGVSLKMDDISVFFIFIQINISHKSKSHMQLQTICNHLCNYKSFLLGAMEHSRICNHKNH
jgi:hypothetical protein